MLYLLTLLACSGAGHEATEASTVTPVAEASTVWNGSTEDGVERAQRAVAEALGVKPDEVHVTTARAGAVPGALVFQAYLKGQAPDPSKITAGLVTGAGVDLDLDSARATVVRAWGYGPDRSVDAATFAAVMGALDGKEYARDLILNQRQLDMELKRWESPPTLPEEFEQGGAPGVRWYATQMVGEIFTLWKVEAVVGDTVTVTATQVESQ